MGRRLIILDTNQLVKNITLDTPVVGVLKAMSEGLGVELAVPSIVVDEFLANYERQLTAKIKSSRSKIEDVRHVAPPGWSPPEIPYPDPRIAAFDHGAKLRSIFRQLATPIGAEAEGLRREIHRQRPASISDEQAGSGARDVVVWLTVLEQLRESEKVYFVSQNTGDFGQTSLYRELQEEAVANGPGTVSYFTGIEELLAELGDKSELTDREIEGLCGSPPVISAVEESLTEPEKQSELATAVFRYTGANQYGLMQKPSAHLTGIKTGTVYGLRDRKWISCRAFWTGEVEVSLVTNIDAYFQPGVWTLVVSFSSTIIIEIDSESTIVTAQVLALGRFKILSAYPKPPR